MLKFLLQLKRRIQRLLKIKSATRQSKVLSRRTKTIRVFLIIVFCLLVVLLYPTEDIYDPFDTPRRGDIAREDVIAPFTITAMKSAAVLEEERKQTRQSIPIVLAYDSSVVKRVETKIDRFFDLIDSLREVDPNPSPGRQDEFFATVANRFPISLSSSTITRSLSGIDSLELVRDRIKRIYKEDIYRVGFFNDLVDIPDSRIRTVIILHGIQEVPFPRDRLMDKNDATGRLLTVLNRLAATDSLDVNYHYNLAIKFIEPNLTVAQEIYGARITEALAEVSGIAEEVQKEEIIIRAGQKVLKGHEELLREMARIQRLEAVKEWGVATYLPVLGRVLLVGLLFMSLYLFLFYFRQDMYLSGPRLLALFLVFGIQLFLVYLADYVAEIGDVESIYIYPVAVLPIMLAILFDAEVGILSSVILALLLGVMYRFSFLITFLTMVVGIVASLSSNSVRKRSDYYRIMLAVVATYILFIFAIENLRLTPSDEILPDLLYGGLVGLFSIPIVIFLVPFFESLFGFTTDITLLELSDLNNPLLKRLALEAPGTYHHSIAVGNLSEAAAEAIGANSLLARVGTYYHDIGKIEIPEYFVENQLSVTSRHESLTPSMSTMILSSHVKKGRLLGEEAGIPDEVLNFIEEHHGTMVMSYFYNKALEQGEDKASIAKYRYPGPKPQTRETGISMLADAVEAASRTLDDPKPARIASLIQRIIDDRFKSGELDECPLTLRDLARIKEAFAAVLTATFHHRVRYPSPSEVKR